MDLSVVRSFPLKRFGESGKLQIRADFYNALNHANLGDPIVSNTGFGVFSEAFYGKSAAPSAGVSVVPLDEEPRRIEFQLKVLF
ncbi:MAG TPA: hypothetical protein VG273_10545 [Bryobacteraceae bacterium]|jgi:hypothetical protein|nr:hypothetical protein [Bryobacteraceae bacterium]